MEITNSGTGPSDSGTGFTDTGWQNRAKAAKQPELYRRQMCKVPKDTDVDTPFLPPVSLPS